MESTAVCLLMLLAAVANIQSANIKYPVLPDMNSRSMAPQQWNTKDAEGKTNFGYAHHGQAAANVLNADGHMVGSWSYLNPEGAEVKASYTADDQGFNVQFNNLPVVPVASPVVYVEDKVILAKSDVHEDPVIAEDSRCTNNELRSRMANFNATFKMTESEEATPNQYPFLVSLVSGSEDDNDLESFCGGSLIAPDKVLTAAHCITEEKTETLIKNDFHVRLGVHTITKTKSDSMVTRKVKNMVIHENYLAATFENDMAILTLNRPVTSTVKIQPICLAPACFDTDGTQPIGMGWGHIKNKGPASEYVRHAVLPVVENKKCQEIYQETDNIIDSMICAHGGDQDTCQGDSGGPLVLDYGSSVKTCRFMQIGVVSYGKECGGTIFPGVYMRVSSYLEWLGAKVPNCGCEDTAK